MSEMIKLCSLVDWRGKVGSDFYNFYWIIGLFITLFIIFYIFDYFLIFNQTIKSKFKYIFHVKSSGSIIFLFCPFSYRQIIWLKYKFFFLVLLLKNIVKFNENLRRGLKIRYIFTLKSTQYSCLDKTST